MCGRLAERVDLLPTRPRREYRRDVPAVTLSNDYGLCKSPGSLAIFAAIRLASSLLSRQTLVDVQIKVTPAQ